jgi:hypothetical protein
MAIRIRRIPGLRAQGSGWPRAHPARHGCSTRKGWLMYRSERPDFASQAGAGTGQGGRGALQKAISAEALMEREK